MSNLLNALARTHTGLDGAVTFHLLPFTTLAHGEAIRQLRDRDDLFWEEGGELRASAALLLWLSYEPHTIDITFHDISRDDVKALKIYWQNRPANAYGRWLLAQYALSDDVRLAWYDAYEATRDVPIIDEKPDDPKEESASMSA